MTPRDAQAMMSSEAAMHDDEYQRDVETLTLESLRAELIELHARLDDPYERVEDPWSVGSMGRRGGIEELGIVPMTDPGWIYFARARGTDLVKVGFTTGDIAGRLKSLQTGCPYELLLEAYAPGAMDDERGLHDAFAPRRVHLEWFRLSAEEVECAAWSQWDPARVRSGICATCDRYGIFDETCRWCTGEWKDRDPLPGAANWNALHRGWRESAEARRRALKLASEEAEVERKRRFEAMLAAARARPKESG